MMLVLDKPAGLAVHPGPGGGETLQDHLDDLRFGLPRRPEAAHRLDRDTSGCLVLGRHPQALRRLGELFRTGQIEKVYHAAVAGGPSEPEGEIGLAIGPQPGRAWRMRVDPQGQPALTRWRVLGRCAERDLTLLELRPVTGRTHQLRVHCSAMGWPILGDAAYGDAPRGGPTLHLHAHSVAVPLHPKKPAVRVEAPEPAWLQEAAAACGA